MDQPRVSTIDRLGATRAFRPSRGALLTACLPASLGLVVVGLVTTFSGHVLVHPAWFALQRTDLVLAPEVVGVYWWRKRPRSRFGPLLILSGVASAPLYLEASSSPVLRTLGSLYAGVAIIVAYVMVLAFPSGRLSGRGTQAALATILTGVIVSVAAYVVLAPSITTSPLSRCVDQRCPRNPFVVHASPATLKHIHDVTLAIAIVGSLLAAIVLVRRLALATSYQRRAYLAGNAVSVVFVTVAIVYSLDTLVGPGLIAESSSRLNWALALTRAVVPWGFLAALIAAELGAGRTLAALVLASLEDQTTSGLEDSYARVFGDRHLRLGIWHEDEQRYVDPDGTPLPPPGNDRQELIEVSRADGRAAAIIHTVELGSEPELARAAAIGALLALDNARLGGQLRTTIDELRQSRRRLISAGDAERQRLERDLHDGAQQRLFSARIQLTLIRERADGEDDVTAELDVLETLIDEASRELRDLAHGIYPTVLAAEGLPGALRAAARRFDLPISVSADVRRFSSALESAVYFCCLEALQNAAKHGGAGTRASVVVAEGDDTLVFTVADQGVGFDPKSVSNGLGLQNMSDRIRGLGGQLDVESSPAGGVVVTGSVPTDRLPPRSSSSADEREFFATTPDADS
jgi:signal transduction histidine kinase